MYMMKEGPRQDANEIIWNYFLTQLNNTINAKKAKWDVYVNSVKESWNDTVNSIQTGWSYAVPGANDTVSVGVLDVGISVGWAFTDAEDVDGLLGSSSAIGASGGYLGYAAVDLISFEDLLNILGQESECSQ